MKTRGFLSLPAGLRRRSDQITLIWRAIRHRRALRAVADRTSMIGKTDILLFATLRNEADRLPYFLSYYRKLGVRHFLIVDNDSSDGGGDYLRDQPDVSVWHSRSGYRGSRFGMDWLGWLLMRHGHGHWCLTVDPDEFLVYPHCDTRPLPALTSWLDGVRRRSFPAMLLDLYPQDEIGQNRYRPGDDPFATDYWFDPVNYIIRKNGYLGNLWIQGGARARVYFADDPDAAPALNKIPLVKWHRSYAYVSSTHMLLPKRLNRLYCETGGEMESGCLLHAKFLPGLAGKAAEEATRCQHYAGGREYRAYRSASGPARLWCSESREYRDWRQLEEIGLMSRGNWA